jgi:hypothetical protein
MKCKHIRLRLLPYSSVEITCKIIFKNDLKHILNDAQKEQTIAYDG